MKVRIIIFDVELRRLARRVLVTAVGLALAISLAFALALAISLVLVPESSPPSSERHQHEVPPGASPRRR